MTPRDRSGIEFAAKLCSPLLALRILITTPVFPPDLGGPAVYVPSIGRWLAGRGHSVKVVAFCEDPNPQGYPFPVVSIPRVAVLEPAQHERMRAATKETSRTFCQVGT